MTSVTGPSAACRILWFFVRLCLTALGVMVVAGAILRWDRLHSLHDPRWQIALTLVGLAIGGWLAGLQARGAYRYPWIAAISVATIVLSQTCYLVLVWTSWKMHPLIWRVWWLSMIAACHSTHIIWLRMAAPPDRRGLVRVTIACALLTSLLLAVMGLRRHLLADVAPLHIWMTALAAGMATLGSVVLWLRGIHLSAARVPPTVKIAWLLVGQALLVLAAFYAGRVTAPSPPLFEPLPSLLANLSPAELESQARSDLDRLKIVVAGLDDLIAKGSALQSQLQQRRAADSRQYFTPDEEDQLRRQFMSYLSYRAALLRMVATYAGFQSVRDPALRARCMLLGYAAGTGLFDADRRFVSVYGDDQPARRKLNEADPEAGIPAGMLDRIRESVFSGRNAQALAEMEAYFETHREVWASGQVWPAEDWFWIEKLIDRSAGQIRQSALDRAGARFEQILARVRQDSYTPAYAAQSVVSTWIGDTRLAQWEPLISREQILAIQEQLRPGDILLERRNWFLSNAFLPGFWPHAALYVGATEDLERLGLIRREGNRYTSDDPMIRDHLTRYLAMAADGQPHTVIESVSEGVIVNSLTESLHADYVAVLRPRLDDAQKARAIARAFAQLGKPYDFEFDFFSADKLVCTELVYRAYEGLIHFELVRVMGRDTLPALEIARKFAKQRGTPDRQLDFVLFLDRVPGEHRSAPSDEEAFCSSIGRPREFNE
ncbi:MAG TPA: YiiX/YebB-like N1pC/P60 family cysteine hydrolase [Phycisphaerae bacterium]|nr:YiiX/YebB-like N1pC/P60 family cysteine hydrolase [Phycisphaerae bacterium]HRR84921.1 YiiX/YebB-like N1pC/P60 family cysteine hydrolase [Phycisphaerae bacterium]